MSELQEKKWNGKGLQFYSVFDTADGSKLFVPLLSWKPEALFPLDKYERV